MSLSGSTAKTCLKISCGSFREPFLHEAKTPSRSIKRLLVSKTQPHRSDGAMDAIKALPSQEDICWAGPEELAFTQNKVLPAEGAVDAVW